MPNSFLSLLLWWYNEFLVDSLDLFTMFVWVISPTLVPLFDLNDRETYGRNLPKPKQIKTWTYHNKTQTGYKILGIYFVFKVKPLLHIFLDLLIFPNVAILQEMVPTLARVVDKPRHKRTLTRATKVLMQALEYPQTVRVTVMSLNHGVSNYQQNYCLFHSFLSKLKQSSVLLGSLWGRCICDH